MAAMRARMLTVVAVGLAVACGTGSVLVHRAFSPDDGDSVAEDLARDHAERLNTQLGYRDRPRDAASIAATEVDAVPAQSRGDGPAQAARVTTLDWSGRVHSSEQATIDVRFTVAVSATTGHLGPGHTAGSATRCYRYTLEYHRHTRHREIRCPDVTRQVASDRVQREPGETGCGTALYTHPVR